MNLKISREELEITGYDFMGFSKEWSDAEHTAVAVGEAPTGLGSMRVLVDALVEKLDRINEVLRRSRSKGEWFSLSGIEDIGLANIPGIRLTFTHVKGNVAIDVFHAGDISLPVAKGKKFAFCPFRGSSGQIPAEEYEETAMLLCRALAQLDS